MKLNKQPILEYSSDHVPISNFDVKEMDRMINKHREAAKARAKRGESGVRWENKIIPDADITKKLTEFRDRQIALRN